MNLNLTVLTSTSIKRKKPWPKITWLGKHQGGLYLLDKSRVSQLYLPSGKTQRKIPSVQPFLIDVQALSASSNGQYLAGVLKSGKVFVWERDNDSLHTTPVLDKIRNVLGSKNKKVCLFISNCGEKIILLSGFHQIFLWESECTPLVPGEPFTGNWVQIQSGDYLLPSDQDKESAVDGIFYEDQVHGSCALVSWVFNKQDKVHITTLRLQWPQFIATVGLNSSYDHDNSLSFTAKWYTFVHPLYDLTPATRVIKSSKAYIGCFSHDGQVLAVAMNQKNATDSRMMFYSTTSSSVAIVTDLQGCGAANALNVPASGRLWWISDMSWTSNSLLLVVITCCGSLAILTKLGEPVLISTTGCSIDMGPGLYLPLHPRITFSKASLNGDSDTSMSSHSDVLRQRFSVTVHPNLPIIFTTDGYLVTVMQLPGNASYKEVMAMLMSATSSLVPEVQLDPNMVPLSSSTSTVNIFQSETNLSRVQSVEELSENTQSSCSSSLAGYGLASGDQGMAFMPMLSSELCNPPYQHQDKSWKFMNAQISSLQALALGVSAGTYWSKDISSALYFVIRGVVKLFSIYLRDHESMGSLKISLKILSKDRSTLKNMQSQKLDDCFTYFKMALELFKWDSSYRNAFTLALRLIHGIIKEILGCKQLADIPKISSSIQFLHCAEEILGSVYSWKQSSKTSSKGQVIDGFSPNKSIHRDNARHTIDISDEPQGGQESSGPVSEAESSQLDESMQQESSQISKALAAPWLVLYNYTAQSSKHWNQHRTEEIGESDGISSRLTQLLCDIQKKLQDIGVSIPTASESKSGHKTAVASFIERNQDETLAGLSSVDTPGDSLFGRRRAHLVGQEPNQSTPLRKTASLDRLLDVSTIGMFKPHESTTSTLLAILYLNLQHYNLRSALELVFSLMEPALDHLNATFSALFASTDALRVSRGQEYSSSQLLSVLLQNFPIVCVADKCGIPVVQTLGRFMAAYFSNLHLYVFPAYHPNVLPPFYLGDLPAQESTSDESFALSQGVEMVHLDREKVASAVRDQGISDVWCANNALELMLISGLIGEACWLSNNLGDWKHALLLSVSHSLVRNNIPVSLLPNIPQDITPEKIILSRLHPVLHSPPSSLPNIPRNSLDIPDSATSTPKKDRLIVEEPNDGKIQLEIDEKLVKDVGKILQAAVVAGLDVVPILCWKMLQELLVLVSHIDWIVPEGYYLPAPPLFCPQPPNVQTEFLLPRVYREKQLRSDIASSVQKLLTLFHSCNCMAACMQWYVNQLVTANEKWYNIAKDDQDFIVPQSLLEHSDMVTSFAAADLSLIRALKRNSPKSKDMPSVSRASKTPGSSVSVVLASFQQFCIVMWLLHARDKMSLCARKYRHARNATKPEIAEQVEGLCWETLQWTLQLQPFGSFLGASAQVNDSLLTLLSEMQPSITTAQITAQHFPDSNLIHTTSGRAKFKRLMTQFRAITLREAGSIEEDNSDEPLSVFYREKCLEWEDELKERERLFNKVMIEVFQREINDDDLPHGSAKPTFLTNKDLPCVGSLVFETSQCYLEFLDTFFIITFTKTAEEMTGQATTAIPLLLPYEKLFTFTETKTLRELQVKTTVDKERKPPVETSLYRSQSYTDVRSTKPRQSFSGVQTGIRRSSSMSDVNKANSGIAVLGADILDMLPRLAWLSRWSSESSLLPSSKSTTEGHPVMKVDVALPMLVNSLWLLNTVYTPWELNEHVKPEFLKEVPKPINEQERLVPSEIVLRRARSETYIPKVSVQSPTTEEESLGRNKEARELKKKRPKREEQRVKVTTKCHSDTDSTLPRIVRNDTVPHPATRGTRKKTKNARRALKLDVQDDGAQITNVKDEERKSETRRKKKTSKVQPSPIKTATSDQIHDAGQDMSSEKSKLDPLTIEEVSPVMAITDMTESYPATGNNKPETSVRPGTQTDELSPGYVVESGSNQPQKVHGGVELVLMLRSNPSSQSNGNATGADVPLLKLSTMVPNNTNQHPTKREAKANSKDIASQTDTNFSILTASSADSDRSVTNFSAQYDESRDASCQTGLSPVHHLQHNNVASVTTDLSQYNGVPSRTTHPSPNHPMQYNGVLSRTTHPSQYDCVPSGTNHPMQYNGVPSRTTHPSQYDCVPSGTNQPMQYNGVPSRTTHPLQYIGVPTGDGHKYVQRDNLIQHPTKIAWPEQSTQNSEAPFPLLHFPEKLYASCARRMVPPICGFPPPSHTTGKEPKEAPTQPAFRLFEVPSLARDLPLLYMPKVQENKQHRPDLSKIKFVDVECTREPCVMLRKGDARRPLQQQQLLHVPLLESKVPVVRNIPINHKHSPMVLLQMPKEKPKPKLVPAEELEAFEKTKRKEEEDLSYVWYEKENVKPKKIKERKGKHETVHKQARPRPNVRNTTSRERRRDTFSTAHPKRADAECARPKMVQVKPAKPEKKADKPVEKAPAPPVQLEEGLSEESELSDNFDDEEQLYFTVQTKPTVSNEQVDEYCRELEARVKEQFEKELEALRQKQVEVEVKERVRKELEKQREQDEVRKRLEEERALQERLKQERQARQEELDKQEPASQTPPHPVPRKRSVKWEKGSFVCYDDETSRTATHSTSHVQTTEPILSGVPADGPRSFVPVIPPDIFLGLTFSHNGDQDLNQETEDKEVAEIEAEGSSKGNKKLSHVKENARQFISVADIDNELWEKIRSDQKIRHREDSIDVQEEHEEQDERVDVEQERVPSKGSSADFLVPGSVEEDLKLYDSLTVKMMGSTEPPHIQRLIRPCTMSTDNAYRISKQRLSTRLEEMNERFEAIEKITHNMDREFQSSNVLLNAIESIGAIMTPPAKSTSSISTRNKKPSTTSRGKRDTAPWRREELVRGVETTVDEREPELKEGKVAVNDTDDEYTKEGKVDFNDTDDEYTKEGKVAVNDTDDEYTKEGKVDFNDTRETENEEEQKAIGEELSFEGEKTPDEINVDESDDVTPSSEEPSHALSEARDATESEPAQRPTEDKLHDKVSSSTSRKPLQDMVMLSSEVLKDIFSDSNDYSSKRSERSAEKRKKVKDWMTRKRKERHTEWKNHVEELRSTEFKPFTTTTEGPSSLKKRKLAEKERETKRRTREDTHIDERIKEASNLINAMLAEPVPNTLQNLHYAPPTSRDKNKHNNRYTTKTKHIPIRTKKSSEKIGQTHHREPNHVLHETPNMDSRRDFGGEVPFNRYGVDTRSVTPSGSDFVTTKTYRLHEKEKLRRSQELENQIPDGTQRQQNYGQPKMDFTGLYETDQSIDIDHIMDQIPDGSSIDEEGFQDLLSYDSELKQLLTGALGSKFKGGRKATPTTVTISKGKPVRPSTKSSSRSTRNIATGSSTRSITKQQSSRLSNNKTSITKGQVTGVGYKQTTNNRLPSNTRTTAMSRGTKTNHDIAGSVKGKTSKDAESRLVDFDDVSPWNTGDSLKMSDDVAQLLADTKQALADERSESSGSIMSNIDWDAVDKIMNDV